MVLIREGVAVILINWSVVQGFAKPTTRQENVPVSTGGPAKRPEKELLPRAQNNNRFEGGRTTTLKRYSGSFRGSRRTQFNIPSSADADARCLYFLNAAKAHSLIL